MNDTYQHMSISELVVLWKREVRRYNRICESTSWSSLVFQDQHVSGIEDFIQSKLDPVRVKGW
jgi:hypothetical protein